MHCSLAYGQMSPRVRLQEVADGLCQEWVLAAGSARRGVAKPLTCAPVRTGICHELQALRLEYPSVMAFLIRAVMYPLCSCEKASAMFIY